MFGGFLDLASEENFVEDGIDFVKVEDEVELADVAKECVWTCAQMGGGLPRRRGQNKRQLRRSLSVGMLSVG